MAKRRNLKKSINMVCADLLMECLAVKQNHPGIKGDDVFLRQTYRNFCPPAHEVVEHIAKELLHITLALLWTKSGGKSGQ